MSLRFIKDATNTSSPLANRINTCADLTWRLVAAGVALFALTVATFAEIEVRTIGGGRLAANGPDYGFVDGDTLQASQFDMPMGLAVDAADQIYIADRDNGAIRKLDVAKNRSRTLVSGLNQPVAVAITESNDLYVLTKGDGLVTKFDRFGNATPIASGLNSPTALTLDVNTNIFVTEESGTVVHINANDGSISVVATGLNQPSGIAALDSGLLAVSDTGNNLIRFINRDNGQTVLRIGTGEAGFRDGASSQARFNQPQQIAKTSSGNIVVADRFNHRVRLIDFNGVVSTIYGIDPSAWEGPACIECVPIILPGWFDSTADFAEAREPIGTAVTRDGTLFTTEIYYHLVREITGVTFTGSDIGTTGTNLVVLPPVISPNTGFYPLGQTIAVVNPNSSAFLPSAVYYTTDGSEPTTNSFHLELNGNGGTIFWYSPTRDLTSLRLKAFVGSQASIEVSGIPSTVSEIGVPRDIAAGMGSTVVLPVVVNLRTNDSLKSLQFRVEVTPASPNAPMIPPTFAAMNINANDFIRVATSDGEDSSITNKTFFNVSDYVLGDSRGLVVTMIGTNANFSVKNFAVVAMLSVPIPTSAKSGDTYQIEVVKPSGTSDGIRGSVPLTAMPPHFITVQNVGYEVGDTASAIWYNADTPGLGFGDGILDNADVNNAFSASLGVRVPHLFSDLFDAMDAFPQDTSESVGGDGLIRFLDWQIILQRSLGLDPNRWVRTWSDGGVRVARSLTPTSNRGSRSTGATLATGTAPGDVWYRQASIQAISVEAVQPGVPVDVPVYATVARGEGLAGLAFRVSVQADGTAPALVEPLRFIAGPNISQPIQSVGQSANDLLCGWPLVPSPAFKPALQGTTLLGYLRVTVPTWASQGQVYTVRFQNADGAPNLQTEYDIETFPGSLWVLAAARKSPESISDEWKLRFFGSTTLPASQADADPDGDGISNLLEYQAGTNPMSKVSCLHLHAPAWDSVRNTLVLRWLSAPGKIYTLESSSDLVGGKWDVLATSVAGDGFVQEFPINQSVGNSRFYRLRLQQ